MKGKPLATKVKAICKSAKVVHYYSETQLKPVGENQGFLDMLFTS